MIWNILQALMSNKHMSLHINGTAINIFQDYTGFLAIFLFFVLDFLHVPSSCLFLMEIILALPFQIFSDSHEKISKESHSMNIHNSLEIEIAVLVG